MKFCPKSPIVKISEKSGSGNKQKNHCGGAEEKLLWRVFDKVKKDQKD